MTSTQRPRPTDASLDFECHLPDPPEKVWRALTEPELLAAWLMPNDLKPEVGRRFAFAGPDAPIECEVIEAEQGRLLSYSWRERPAKDTADPGPAFDSVVTFTLARTAAGGTRLRVVHDGFTPVVAIAGTGCGLSLDARKNPVAANAPCMMQRAA